MSGPVQQPRKYRRGCFKCSICLRRSRDFSTVYTTVYGLKRHIFATHLQERGFALKCGIDGCSVELHTRRKLSTHLQKIHPGREWVPVLNEEEHQNRPGETDRSTDIDIITDIAEASFPQPDGTGSLHEPGTLQSTPFGHQCGPSSTSLGDMEPQLEDHEDTLDDDYINAYKEMLKVTNEQRQLNMALSLAQLKTDFNLSQLAIEAVQEWTEGILQTVTKTLIGGVRLATSSCTNASQTPKLDDVFELGEGLANPFHGIGSEWAMKAMLRDKLGYVEPETVVLLEVLNEGVGGKTKVHSMQYVSFLEVLQLLYKDAKFRTELRKRKPNHTTMTDFMDGAYFKNHPLFVNNPSALQLQFYYDGFEVVNPLGSKIQKHNIGALYFSVLNLDPAYRSTLKSICLTALIYESDIKHQDIGWDVILRRFNSDLKKLEDGLHFHVDGADVFVQGTVVQWALDNKAAHSIFGLQESFYGNGSCISRYCHCTSEDIQLKSNYKQCDLRNKETFDRDQTTLEQTGDPIHGIKSKCCLQSQYFHRGDAFAADIHHDVLEGLIPGMLKPILQELVRKRFFSLQLLNSRVSNFDYKIQDTKNRPSIITEAKLREDSRSLKQYAAQYWCLLRKLPLIIGDRVPTGDDHWTLLIQLLDTVDLIMAPKVQEETLAYLEMQLLILFREFQRLFPDIRITPKMHYTLHYPRLMREVGPLVRHWVMRYEAKHHFFKRTAVLTGNFINVAKTLAVRHQVQQVVHVHQGGLLHRDVLADRGQPENLAKLQHGNEISALLNVSKGTVCNKVTIHGTVYRTGDAILTGFDCDGTVEIGQICQIILSSLGSVCFSLNMYNVLEFDEHFHSWKIEMPVNPDVINCLYSALPDHQPVGIHFTYGNSSCMFANFRYYVLPPNK